MTVSRVDDNCNLAIKAVDKPFKNVFCLKYAVRIVTSERTRRQMIGDLGITVVAIPLLVTCIILLYSCMKSNWVRSYEARLQVLALGLCLLLLSCLVCIYTIRRLQLCVYPTHDPAHPRCRRRTLSSRACPAPLLPSDSQMQLVVGGESPPSYDSVTRRLDLPPPYYTLTLCHENGPVTRPILHPIYVNIRPTG